MPIFQIKNKKLSQVKEKKFDFEKDLQKLTEENLEIIFGLEFISSEFGIHNFYIDTLAFDSETRSFVVIEYKRDQSFSVVDQGLNYLSLMLNNKSDFILEYNEKKKKNLKRGDVDWSQSRVLFVAPSFTPHQRGAIGFKDLPIELWEVEIFEDNLILFNQLKSPEAKESIKTVTKGKAVATVSREVREYTIEDHRKKASPKIRELFEKLREKIFSIDENIKEKPVKFYIGYKFNWYNFASIHVYQNKLRIYVRKKKLKSDKEKLFKRVPASYEWGKTPLWWIDVLKEEKINYILEIVKESCEVAPDR